MKLVRLVAGLFIATSVACVSTPSLRAEGASDSSRGEGDLRVMTFNIQSALKGLDTVAETIRSAQPDIVALQEVDVNTRRSHGLNQSAELAQRTGLRHYAHFRTTTLYGGDYGVGLISRYPLESVEQFPLPVQEGTEPRTVARVVMNVNGQQVSVYVTHLTRRPFNGDIRVRQSAAIMKLMASDPRPKLLMGDMNDTPDSRSLRLFKRELMDVFALRGQGEAETYPLPVIPNLRIDYVMACDHFMPRSSRVMRVKASDHYPVVADLTLLDPTRPPSAELVSGPRMHTPTVSSQ